MTQFVDWDLAASTARTFGGAGPSIGLEAATEAVNQLRGMAAEATGHVAEFTGLRPHSPPPVRVVDRGDWADANIAGLKGVLDPLARKMSGQSGTTTRFIGSRVAGAQAGAVLGYLSGKVLGQYEVFGDHNGQLLLVAPNIVAAERELRADVADFRMWVCLHEAAHAAQFGGVPWLREHFLAEIDAFATASAPEPGQTAAERFGDQARKAASMLSEAMRDSDGGTSVVDLITSPAQREIVDRITALMTLLEGHADFVMDGVGPQVVSSVTKLRERLDRRRQGGGPMQRLTRRLLGMDVKLRQYVQGKKFTETVVATAGMDGFNLVWREAANLPTMAEIDDPALWIERVAV
jgi:coenzyme F420 biosynthesis associated uncharacterized protein